MIYTDNEQLLIEIKKLLLETKTTQVQLADKLNISKQNLAGFLRKKHLTFDDLQRLLSVLGYTLDFNFIHRDNLGS